mmetsp:Transcript_40536/g.127207  ORF Transcript_40536/g.127207 Transcript_40536/m.127207 type:complete len:223 (+) Transcript_40536:1196-1864(+)
MQRGSAVAGAASTGSEGPAAPAAAPPSRGGVAVPAGGGVRAGLSAGLAMRWSRGWRCFSSTSRRVPSAERTLEHCPTHSFVTRRGHSACGSAARHASSEGRRSGSRARWVASRTSLTTSPPPRRTTPSCSSRSLLGSRTASSTRTPWKMAALLTGASGAAAGAASEGASAEQRGRFARWAGSEVGARGSEAAGRIRFSRLSLSFVGGPPVHTVTMYLPAELS